MKTSSPYRMPLLLWGSALAGLVLSLITEGPLDVLALLMLGFPLGVVGERVRRS